MAGRRAAMDDRAVTHRQVATGIAESPGGMVEKQAPHLGACQAQCDRTELDRLAASRIALIGCEIGVTGLQQDARGGDV
jgi:hypothetical protein